MQPNRNKKKGTILVWIGRILTFSSPLLMLWNSWEPNCLGAFGYFGFAIGIGIWRLGNRMKQASAEEAIDASEKPPVLYLRPFNLDDSGKNLLPQGEILDRILRSIGLDRFLQTLNHYEKRLLRVLDNIGPVVAIGKPSDTFAPLGAAREYVSDGEWQMSVEKHMTSAALIIWVLGDSEGVRWELTRAIGLDKPEKLIICLPFAGERIAHREKQWKSFISKFGSIFPKPLPSDVGRALNIRFDEDWTPILVQPKPEFYDRYAFSWPRTERGLTCTLDEMSIDYGAKSPWRSDFMYLVANLIWVAGLAFIAIIYVQFALELREGFQEAIRYDDMGYLLLNILTVVVYLVWGYTLYWAIAWYRKNS